MELICISLYLEEIMLHPAKFYFWVLENISRGDFSLLHHSNKTEYPGGIHVLSRQLYEKAKGISVSEIKSAPLY